RAAPLRRNPQRAGSAARASGILRAGRAGMRGAGRRRDPLWGMEQGDFLSAGPARRDLTAAAIRARLRDHAAGLRISEGARGDHSLSGGAPPKILTPAA